MDPYNFQEQMQQFIDSFKEVLNTFVAKVKDTKQADNKQAKAQSALLYAEIIYSFREYENQLKGLVKNINQGFENVVANIDKDFSDLDNDLKSITDKFSNNLGDATGKFGNNLDNLFSKFSGNLAGIDTLVDNISKSFNAAESAAAQQAAAAVAAAEAARALAAELKATAAVSKDAFKAKEKPKREYARDDKGRFTSAKKKAAVASESEGGETTGIPPTSPVESTGPTGPSGEGLGGKKPKKPKFNKPKFTSSVKGFEFLGDMSLPDISPEILAAAEEAADKFYKNFKSTMLDTIKNTAMTASDIIDAEFTVLGGRLGYKGPTGGGTGGGGGGGGGPPSGSEEPLRPGDPMGMRSALGSNFLQRVFTQQFAKLSAALKPLINTVKSLNTVFNAFKKGLWQLTKFATATALFVEAFNPASVDVFLYALKDFSAVIGMGLMPVLDSFINIIRLAGDTFYPVVKQLMPALKLFGDALVNFLAPIIYSVADTFLSLSEYINGTFAPVFKEFAAALGTSVGEVIKILVGVLLPVFTALAKAATVLLNVLNTLAPALEVAFTLLVSALIGKAVAALYTFTTALATAAYRVAASQVAASVAGGAAGGAVGGAAAGGIIATLLNWGSKLLTGLKYLGGILIRFLGGPLGAIITGLSLAYSAYQYFKTPSKESTRGITGVSSGLAARQAEYGSVEDIGRNLIRASFSGANVDRLRGIYDNGKETNALLGQIVENTGGGLEENPNQMQGLKVVPAGA